MTKGCETPSSASRADDPATSQNTATARAVGKSRKDRRPHKPIDKGAPRPKSIANHVRSTIDGTAREKLLNRRSRGTRETVPFYDR
jgi:hypothetical protein